MKALNPMKPTKTSRFTMPIRTAAGWNRSLTDAAGTASAGRVSGRARLTIVLEPAKAAETAKAQTKPWACITISPTTCPTANPTRTVVEKSAKTRSRCSGFGSSVATVAWDRYIAELAAPVSTRTTSKTQSSPVSAAGTCNNCSTATLTEPPSMTGRRPTRSRSQPATGRTSSMPMANTPNARPMSAFEPPSSCSTRRGSTGKESPPTLK